VAQCLQFVGREGRACMLLCLRDDRTSDEEEGSVLSIQPHVAQVLPGAECARLEAVTDVA